GPESGGVYVFSTSDDQQISGPLDTGLPPNQVLFDRESNVVTAAPSPKPSDVFAASSWPNPARRDAYVELKLTAPARLRIDIVDASGRRVRTIGQSGFAAGSARLRWDIADEGGHRVPPGIYFVRARIDEKSEKIVGPRLVVLY